MPYIPPAGDAIEFPGSDALPDIPYDIPPGDAVEFPGRLHPVAPPLPRRYVAGWGRGVAADRRRVMPWPASGRADRITVAGWTPSSARRSPARIPWPAARPADPEPRAIRWGAAVAADRRAWVPWLGAAIIDAGLLSVRWQRAGSSGAAPSRIPWGATAPAEPPATRTPWGAATVCDQRTLARWLATIPCDLRYLIPWGPTTLRDRADPTPPIIVWPIDPDAEYEIPLRPIYTMPYDASLVRLPDGANIPVSAMTIDTDIDSWGWRLSADVLGRDAIDLLQPGVDPVTVQATVNGYLWEFLIDDPQMAEAWGNDQYRITGRSVTAQLAAPYAVARDHSATTTQTAQQHALQELPLSGWTLDWRAPDWIIPAAAWTYQGKTPVQAIARLAAGVGAALQSDLAGQALIVLPRFRSMPWELDGAVVEYGIPTDTVLTLAHRRQAVGTRANAVYIHGSEHGGITGHVVRNGTAGDIVAPTETDPLCTDSIAARGRGGSILAGLHQPPGIDTVSLPLSSASGDQPLPGIGDIISITTSSSDDRGLCHGISVTVTAPGLGATEGPEITQTLTLHGRTANAYSRLQRLTPVQPLLVGTVSSVSGNSAIVQLLGGGLVTVRGTAAVGATVYLRAGAIEGPAPSLPGFEIGV